MMKLYVKTVMSLVSFLLLVFLTACAGDVNSSLLAAAQKGNVNKVNALLEKGAGVKTVDKDGNTSLIIASEKGHTDVVRVLLAKGSSVYTENNNGQTALETAVGNEHSEVVQALKEVVNSDFLAAAREGNTEKVRELLEVGAEVNAKDEEGWTPLHHAAREGHKDVVEFLLSNGAEVNAKNKERVTPLPLADLFGGHYEIAQLLRDAGAEEYYYDEEIGIISLVKDDLTFQDRKAWRWILDWPDECEESFDIRDGTWSGLTFWQLEAEQYLVEVVCFVAAYQANQMYIYYDESGFTSNVLTLEIYSDSETFKEVTDVGGLAEVDQNKRELTIWTKFRGLGDCGSLARYYIVDGIASLIEFRMKSDCDEEMKDPTEYELIFPENSE